MSIVRAIQKQNKPAWRNGRRTRLKIWRWQHRMGSSPIAGIEKRFSFYWIFFLIHDNRMFTERAFYYLLLDEIKIKYGRNI